MSQPFTQRHIGTDADAQSRMLAVLGHSSVESLVNAAVPATIQVEQFRREGDSTLPPAATEREAIQELRALADKTELQYTAEHEWVLVDGDTATVGITAYAADKLGDVVFVELPDVGSSVAAGTVVGEIESTKSVGELFAPIDGTVAEINGAVVDSPELVNSDPLGDGWLIKVSFETLPTLLSYAEYSAIIGE